jgi:hypothetical protein
VEYLRRLRNFWFPDRMAIVWLLFALPALYFFQTTIHEGTHALAALVQTGSMPKVAPFPHSQPDGDFLNGVTIGDAGALVRVIERASCDSPARTAFNRLAGFAALPQFVALGLVVLLSVIFGITTIASPVLRVGLRAWYLGACIDFMYGSARGLIGGCNESADWGKFMLRADIAPGWFALLTWVLWLGVLSHFLWVYWAQWARVRTARTYFWDYRWLALVLGILSLIAVLLSVLVSDPLINKRSVAFILPLVVQFLALGWYWIYFGLTFWFRR